MQESQDAMLTMAMEGRVDRVEEWIRALAPAFPSNFEGKKAEHRSEIDGNRGVFDQEKAAIATRNTALAAAPCGTWRR